jgi:hypothetical protein
MATTLAADMDAVETTLTVNAGHDAIATGDTLTIDTEKMTVTSVSGVNVGVTRAQNGTTAAAHTTGAPITITPAAKSICSQIAVDPSVTPAGFLPVPTHVFLGTCADASSEPTWSEIANVESITIPSPAVSMLDVNNLANNSGVVLQIPGLATPGDIQMVINYWPDEPSHDEIAGIIKLSKTRETRPFKIESQYSADHVLRVTFAGFVTALPMPFTATAPMKLTCTLRQYGDATVERVNLSDGSIITQSAPRAGRSWQSVLNGAQAA